MFDSEFSSKPRVWSIDGGGIRGLMPAFFLGAISQNPGIKTAVGNCELLAGTSTGALIAAVLATGGELGQLTKLYEKLASKIFQPSAWALTSWKVFDYEKFIGSGIETALREHFGDAKLGDVVVPLIVVAYHTNLRRPIVFKSWNRRDGHDQLFLRDVCRASAAAPGFFPPHLMQVAGADIQLVDGGIAANNPTLCAYAECRRYRKEPIVLSIGTGIHLPDASSREVNGGLKSWGQYGVGFLDTALTAPNQCTDYIMRQIARDDYFRVDFQSGTSIALDDISDAAFNIMKNAALGYITSPEGSKAMNFLNRIYPVINDGNKSKIEE